LHIIEAIIAGEPRASSVLRIAGETAVAMSFHFENAAPFQKKIDRAKIAEFECESNWCVKETSRLSDAELLPHRLDFIVRGGGIN